MYSSRRERIKTENFRQKIFLYGLLGIIGMIIIGFVISLGVFAWFAKDLPSPGKLSQSSGSSTVFYDRDGKVLYEMYKDKNRVPVVLKDTSLYLQKGTVAIEDKNFYKHKGISETGILRAFLSTALGRGMQGGSTITQQLIKNVLLDSSRTASRKIKEMMLALEVERRYKKDEILAMYLNEAPYGGSFWGVESASRGYFGKQAKDLNLLESAILAGLPQSPSLYSPYIGKNDAWRGRTKDVLKKMYEEGYITRSQEEKAIKQVDTYKFSSPKLSITAPHFVFYVKDQIEKEFGPKILEQGIKVKTTLSLDVQLAAEKIVQEQMEQLKGFDVGNAAVIVLDSQSGEILAMVGSYDFNNEDYGKFNASMGLRQPGSAIKPVTYAVAFEKGYTPATVLMDAETVFPNQGDEEYKPVNYDGKFRGPVQVRFALGNSLNIPAVKMLAMVGIRDFMSKAQAMGLETLTPTSENLSKYGLSITLGGGETTLLDLTSAYSIFARGGTKKDIQSINEINNFNGKILYKSVKPREKKVFSPEVSFLISHILSDNNARMMEFGPNSYLNITGKTVAVKTGTTDDKRDNWTVGYTKSLTAGVWVGNNDNSPMNPKIASGITGASPIWHYLMSELLKKYSDGIIDKPDNVKAVTINAYAGGLPKDGFPTRSEYFIEGAEPKETSNAYKKIKLSKANSSKLANDVEIRQGSYEEKDYIVFTESDPISTDGKNLWQEGIDAWARSQGDDRLKPPTDTSEANSDIILVSLKSPNDKTTINTNNIEIRARITSLVPVKKVELYIDGNKIKEYDGNRDEIIEPMGLSDGVHIIRVIGRNEKDKTGDSVIQFGINKAWDAVTPTPTLTPAPTP